MKNLIICLCLLFSVCCRGQNKVFTEAELIAVIKKYHPLSTQAAIDIKIAQAGITISRSPFDPVISVDDGRKDLEGVNYYNQRYRELRIPTWYGIDLYAGREDAIGSRINPDVTRGTLNYVGFSVPLLQNFVIDKRRAYIRQATIFRNLSEVERDIVINELTREALRTYWDWWEGYHTYNLIQSAIANARKRFDLVKIAYQLGDRPAIDTLEALTQVQSLQLRQGEAYINFIKSGLQLSVFLWKEDEVPYELPSDVIPQPWIAADTVMFDAIASLAAVHPELTQYNFKLESLRIDQRLKFQYLLPEVKLKYNQIGKDVYKTLNNAWFANDYRYGLSISMPLRLSEGRGGYRQARLKIDKTQIDRVNKQVQLINKMKQYFIEWQQTAAQVTLQTSVITNVTTLQRGEETRFSSGESSLFLINAREIRTIEAQQKLVEIKSKNKTALVDFKWAAGMFVD